MARGDFLQGLSSGIFERLGQVRQEQQDRDDKQIGNVVNMLAGLVDKVEDPSMLMGHIWDTMGIKKQKSGKGLRGFLDAFSGMPNRSVEDQAGTKFRELTDSFMGAKDARDIRLRGNIATKGIPGLVNPSAGGPGVDKAKADMAGLKNRIVFRDPYEQQLNLAKMRAEASAQLQSDRLNLQNQYSALRQEDQQRHAMDLENLRTENRNSRNISTLSGQLFVANPEKYNFDQSLAHQEAAQMLVGKTEAEIQKIIEDYKLKRDMQQYYRAQTTNQKLGKPESPLQREKFDEQLYGKARAMYQKYGEADTEYNTQDAEAKRIGTILSGYATKRNQRKKNPNDEDMTFDEKLGTFIGPGSLGLNAMYEDMIKKYGEAGKKRTAAEGTRKTRGEELQQTHGKYVEALEGGKFRLKSPEEIKSGFKPQRPKLPGGGPVSTKQPMGDGNTIKVPTGNSADAKAWRTGDTVNPRYLKGSWTVGETITENGREFKVLRRNP